MLTLVHMTSLLAAAVAVALVPLSGLLPGADGRLVLPAEQLLAAYRLRNAAHSTAATEPINQATIDAYFDASGFPKAGRSLADKVKEAEEFLAREFPKTGAVGLGAAVVYKDQVVVSKGYGLRQSNDSSTNVSERALFEIGSTSKSMIAVGIGILVEDGKLAWRDPVKKHLPWLKLYDAYAEKHLNLGDLLSMNSGFGRAPDAADFIGTFPTERALVEALQYCEPEYSLRSRPAYANANFVILGQVIEAVSGLSWDQFIDQRLWKPLGMNHTFASTPLVPATGQELNDGHFACAGDTLGPFNLRTSAMTNLFPARVHGLHAAGSILSSAADMAIYMRMLLNKGKVGDVAVLQSPSTITELTTGKVAAVEELVAAFDSSGLHFSGSGGTVAAGYGFDIVGDSIWGHAYYDKGGDTIAHHTRTGFAPTEHLGVTFMVNTLVFDGAIFLDRFRSYIMGIFLDVPKPVLDAEWTRWHAGDAAPPLPGSQRCGPNLWKDPPFVTWTADEIDPVVGSYHVPGSEKYYPRLEITRLGVDKLQASIATKQGELKRIASDTKDGPSVAIMDGASGRDMVLATPTGAGKGYTFDFGVVYHKM